ncbi:MAG: SPOR domain-containing protein, partial [Pseudomonadota bacterium]
PPPPPPPAAVKPPAPAPAVKAPAATRAAKPAARPAVAKGGLALQFGAFSEPARARGVADMLKRQGYQVHLVPGVNQKGVKLTKVRVGAYANLDQAQRALKAAKAKTGLTDVVIVKNGQD